MFGGDVMNMVNAVWPFILMAAIFYFLLWRPQKKEQQRHQKMLEALKKGDKVITIGGIHGVVTKVGDAQVSLEVAPNVVMDFSKSAINGFQSPAKQKLSDES
jgi:preprotein translocase subunit YajC